MKDGKKDFQYIEYIKGPKNISSQDGKSSQELDLKWMALDYFDYIYVHKVNSLDECMDYENNISCESYQSIGIFRDIEQDEENQNGQGDNLPFMAILQVKFLPEVYQSEDENLVEESKKELEKIIVATKDTFDQTCEIAFHVYYTVNNVDFCILLYSDRLDLAERVSNNITAIPSAKGSGKYSVYDTIAISSDFSKPEEKKYMEDDTVLVTRILLNERFYSQTIVDEFLKNLNCASQSTESNKPISNTHSLPGKYDLSIRIDGRKNILEVLPTIIDFNLSILKEEDKSNSSKDIETEKMDLDVSRNSIVFLLQKNCVKNMNVRIFFCPKCSFSKDSFLKNLEEQEKRDSDVSQIYNKLEKEISENFSAQKFFFAKIMGYMEKLKHIIHTYEALSMNDDTKINMRMLKSYLVSFLNLLLLNAEFLKNGQVQQRDYAMNFLTGINYIHQYIKIITAVNGNSFETPQFGIERDECSIGKLPIAYTEFLGWIFEKYNKTRKDNLRTGDEEIAYYPMYFPLVVPYMQNGDSDLYMTTLFGQNMSDNWDEIKDKWAEYIQNESTKVLMFIVCQDMRQYKDVSALLIASFHELGHYCNVLTRRERNTDLISIYSNVLSRTIVQTWIGRIKTGYRTMYALTKEAQMVAKLEESVYRSLVTYFADEMENVIDYPESVFKDKFSEILEELTDIHANCQNQDVLFEEFADPLFYRARYEFGLCKEKSEDFFEELKEYAQQELKSIKEDVKAAKSSACLKNNDKMNAYLDRFLQYIDKCIQLWEDLKESIPKEGKQESERKKSDESLWEDLSEITAWLNDWKESKSIFDDKEQWQKELRQNLEKILKNLYQSLMFTLQLIEKIEMDILTRAKIKQELQDKYKCLEAPDEVLKSRVEKKEKLIQSTFDHYVSITEEKFAQISIVSDRYYSAYNLMRITPDSGFVSGFKTELNQILMGLAWPEMMCDLQRSCYVESWADIIMCAHLKLEDWEYIIAISDYFDLSYEKDAKWKLSRIVIVLSYIWFVREADEQFQEDNFWENPAFCEDFDDKLLTLQKNLVKENNENCERYARLVGNVLKEASSIIRDDRLFVISFRRIIELKEYLKFDSQENIEFIHEALLENRQNKKEKSPELQNKEIEFVLKYYYLNRRKYSLDE